MDEHGVVLTVYYLLVISLPLCFFARLPSRLTLPSLGSRLSPYSLRHPFTEGDVVRWSTDGKKFGIITGSTLTVYALDMTTLHSLVAPSRFHDLRFCYFPLSVDDPTQKEYMFVACEDGKTRVFDVSSPTAPVEQEEGAEGATLEPVAVLTGHKNRSVFLSSHLC